MRRSFALWIVGILLLWAPDVWAQQQLPAPSQLHEIIDSVQFTPGELAAALDAKKATASQCVVGPTGWNCECVTYKGTQIGTWAWSKSGAIRAENVRFGAGESTVWAGYVDTQSSTAGLVVISEPDGTFAARKTLISSGSATLESLMGQDATVSIPAVCNDGKFAKDVGVQLRPAWTADNGTYIDGQWQLTNVEAGLHQVDELQVGQLRSGLLPPTARIADDTVAEFELAYFVAPIHSAVFAVVAPGGWYGLGIAPISGRNHDRLLRADLRYDDSEGFSAFIDGEAALIYDERTRISLKAEWPNTPDGASVRDVERGTLFRDWTQSELGFGLSGDVTALALRASVLTFNNVDDETLYSGVRYGTSAKPAEHLTVDIDVDQLTYIQGERRFHDAIAGIRLGVPFGKRGRWVVQPDAIMAMNFGVLPERTGFEASTSGTVMLGAESSLYFAGQLGAVRHLITPRIRLQSELYGFSQRTVPPAGSIGFPYTRRSGWTLGLFELGQSFEFGDFTVDLPVGAVSSTEYLEEFKLGTSLYGRLGLHTRQLKFESALHCLQLCDEIGFASNLVGNSNGFSASLGTSRTTGEMIALSDGWSRRTGPTTNWSLSVLSSERITNVHSASIGYAFGPVGTNVRGFLVPDEPRATGGAVSLSYIPKLFGWRWVLDAGLTESEDWNVSLNWAVH